MTTLSNLIARHLDVYIAPRDLAADLVAVPLVLAGLWAGLAIIFAVVPA